MRSTFSGLEIARSAMTANQVALDVTGQNIANVNTENYTRQRADMVAINYNSGVYKNAIAAADKVGQGVLVDKVVQIRDSFLDATVRAANAEYNAWTTKLSALQDVENVFDETESDGLHAMLGNFYNQLQALSGHAGSAEYANILRSAAEKVTQVLNQYAKQLNQIRSDEVSSLNIETENVNTLVSKINNVNARIKDLALRGNVSNELLDLRNGYLDQLSAYMDISVGEQADGTVTVTSTGVDVLSSKFSVQESGGEVRVMVDGGSGPQVFEPEYGNFRGHLDVLNAGGDGANEFRGLPYYQNALDDFAAAFAGTFNDLNTIDPADPKPLFAAGDGGAIKAANIAISAGWRGDPSYIVCDLDGENGANGNVIRMINAMDNPADQTLYPNINATFIGFSRMLMSDIAVDVGYQIDMAAMSGRILDSASYQREAVIGVSINEETINLTKYERAFQAAARLMTVMDESLDIIINRMGIVGR